MLVSKREVCSHGAFNFMDGVGQLLKILIVNVSSKHLLQVYGLFVKSLHDLTQYAYIKLCCICLKYLLGLSKRSPSTKTILRSLPTADSLAQIRFFVVVGRQVEVACAIPIQTGQNHLGVLRLLFEFCPSLLYWKQDPLSRHRTCNDKVWNTVTSTLMDIDMAMILVDRTTRVWGHVNAAQLT